MTMPRECFCFDFWFWYSMWHHYFIVAIGTTISCSLGRRYGPVFSLSFLGVYGYTPLIGFFNEMSMIHSLLIKLSSHCFMWSLYSKDLPYSKNSNWPSSRLFWKSKTGKGKNSFVSLTPGVSGRPTGQHADEQAAVASIVIWANVIKLFTAVFYDCLLQYFSLAGLSSIA